MYYVNLIALLGALLISNSVSGQQGEATRSAHLDVCPAPELTPSELEIDTTSQEGQGEPYVDQSKAIKDIGTDFVVNEFFSSKESLFNFMKLVYNNLERALDEYKIKHNIDDKSIFVLFKGGNVLRMVANGVFEQITNEKALEILHEKYDPDFKRSDADFSVYIDDRKLNGHDYETIFSDVSQLLYAELNTIRDEFKTNSYKYFDFLKLNKNDASRVLKEYFSELKELPIISDKENDKWYQVKFAQMQLPTSKADDAQDCPFYGQFDYRFVIKNGKITGTPLTNEPNWIVNTDNRTPQWPLGSDPAQLAKFGLVRSKIVFEYIFVTKDGQVHRKPIGGELIDVSVPHNRDHSIKEFFLNLEHNVAEYTLLSPDKREVLIFKSYSVDNLSEDLLGILFKSFDRPWHGGPKYKKRVDRFFFLVLAEILANLGSGENASEYIQAQQESMVAPLKNLYPVGDKSVEIIGQVSAQLAQMKKDFPDMTFAHSFWQNMINLAEKHLLRDLKADDQKGFNELLKAAQENLDIAAQISEIPGIKINLNKVYQSDINKIF